MIIEDEAYQKSLYYWLRRDMIQRNFHFPVQLIKNPRNVSQEMRLVSLQPFVHNGAICFAKGMPGASELMVEFESFPKGPHKDLICALYFATQVIIPAPRPQEKKKKKIPIQSRFLHSLIERNRKRNGRMPFIKVGGH